MFCWSEGKCFKKYFFTGNLNKEQVRLGQVLQDKENIIQSQRQEIHRLRQLNLENSEKQTSR